MTGSLRDTNSCESKLQVFPIFNVLYKKPIVLRMSMSVNELGLALHFGAYKISEADSYKTFWLEYQKTQRV